MIVFVINLYLIANNLYPQHSKHMKKTSSYISEGIIVFSLKLFGEAEFLQV